MSSDLPKNTDTPTLSPLSGEDMKKSKVRELFAEFLSLPDPDRAAFMDVPYDPSKRKFAKIPTYTDFALKYGVHTRTLYNWRQQADFNALVKSKREKWGQNLVPNVLAALYTRCIKYGMAYDVETFLAYYEGWSRTQKIQPVGEKFEEGDLRAIISVLPVEEQKQFYESIANILTRAQLRGGSQKVQGDSTS